MGERAKENFALKRPFTCIGARSAGGHIVRSTPLYCAPQSVPCIIIYHVVCQRLWSYYLQPLSGRMEHEGTIYADTWVFLGAGGQIRLEKRKWEEEGRSRGLPTPFPSPMAALWAHSPGSPRKVWRNDVLLPFLLGPHGEPPCRARRLVHRLGDTQRHRSPSCLVSR